MASRFTLLAAILARISAPLLPPRDGVVSDSYARMAGATAVDWSDPLLRAARLVVLILVPSPLSTLVLMTPATIVPLPLESWGSNMATVGTMQGVDVHH